MKGTEVAMADGSKKAIDQIKVGDSVLSYDTAHNKFVVSKVADVYSYKGEKDPYYYIINDKIRATGEHPFFVNGKWIKADNLRVGMKLFDGISEIPITSIKRVNKEERVYDLIVGKHHNFFADGVLVHNKAE